MIPKILHVIWIGDEARRPDNCIQTWRDRHPGWEVRVWGNAELTTRAWANCAHIEAMLQHAFSGVADMMRWEILHEHGGIAIDADSVCLRRLDDELLDCAAFGCWENEIASPGLIAAGYFGCEPGNPLVRAIIEDIAAAPSVVDDVPRQTVGAGRLTDCYRKFAYSPLRIHPSYLFMPKHFTGQAHEGGGTAYAHELWAGVLGTYDQILATAFERPDASPTVAARPVAGGLVIPQTAASIAVPSGGTVAAAAVSIIGTATVQASRAAPSSPESTPAPAPEPERPAIETLHDPYFIQRVEVGTELADLGRLDVFASLCAGKRVLHVGCASDPAALLHVQLGQFCAQLDGFDTDAGALDLLRPHAAGALFTDLGEVAESYDVVLVPAMLGHVPDVADFLARIEAIEASCYLIAVPDAYQSGAGHFEFDADSQTFVEVVHPDHNAWYTPYTLTNTLRKYSGLNLERLWFFDETAILALLSRPATAALAA